MARAELAKARGRRSPRKLLRAKRRGVLTQSQAVGHEIKQTITSPAAGSPAVAVAQLRATLQSLRHDVMQRSAGTHTHVVASALQDLDQSLAKLLAANQTADPKSAMRMLAAGKLALDDAKRKAKTAGGDWPL